MRSLRILLACICTVVLVAAAAPTATAQTQIIEMRMEISVDLLAEGNTLDPGGQTEGFVHGRICWDQGGFNPLGGHLVLTLSQVGLEQAPAWLEPRVSGGNAQEFELPFGPTLEEESCEPFDRSFGLRVNAARDAPADASHTLQYRVDATVEGDSGTYIAPDPATASGVITISPSEDDLDMPDPDAPPPAPPPEANDSPVGPFAFVLALLFALGTLRRRR